MHVLLTGSTGNMGAYILDSLLQVPKVDRVTCLNRAPDSPQRQRSNHSSRRLDVYLLDNAISTGRVQFIHSQDISRNLLGLSAEAYKNLHDARVTTILHNAWPVDFNLGYSSFLPNIQGVKRLLEFCADCARTQPHCQTCGQYPAMPTSTAAVIRSPTPTLFFVSSIAVAGRWGAIPSSRNSVPESCITDWRMAKMGYGQSKLVSERILVEAARSEATAGLRVGILRVGQVAGPIDHIPNKRPEEEDESGNSSHVRGHQEPESLLHGGQWNKKEWLPSLIGSCKHLGCIPADLGSMENIDWIPVDVLGRVMAELLVNGFDDDDPIPRFPRLFENLVRRGKNTSRRGKDSSHHLPRQSHAAARIYHITNPHLTTWSALLPRIVRQLQLPSQPPDSPTSHSSLAGTLYQPIELRQIPFIDWVDELKHHAKQSSQMPTSTTSSIQSGKHVILDKVPAIKLMAFFEDLQDKAIRYPNARSVVLETRETCKKSETLANLECVSERWMSSWMESWDF